MLLDALDAVTSLEPLRVLQAVRLHELTGVRRGRWAMTVNRRSFNEGSSELFRRVGAKSVRIPSFEVFNALNYGAVDAAVVGIYQLDNMAGESSDMAVVWSPDFAPFTYPVVSKYSIDRAHAVSR